MRIAARALIGEHDFRNFCKSDVANVSNHVRTILAFDVHLLESESVPIDLARRSGRGRLCELRVQGFAFLYHQVRCMAAVLFAVGAGLETPDVTAKLLDIEAQPRKPTYEMADDLPLVLEEAAYDGLEWMHSSAEAVAATLAIEGKRLATRLAVIDGFVHSLSLNNDQVASEAFEAVQLASSSPYVPLLDRRCEESFEEKQRIYAAKLKRKSMDS